MYGPFVKISGIPNEGNLQSPRMQCGYGAEKN
jgi:hypothetical protein